MIKNFNLGKIRKILVSFGVVFFLTGLIIPFSFSQAAGNHQNIMPIGALLYKTSAHDKIYGRNTQDIFKIHFLQDYQLKKFLRHPSFAKVELNSGHVGIYVGKNEKGVDMVVEAVPGGIIMDPLKYFVNLRDGSKFLGAKIPINSSKSQRRAAVAIARALAHLKLKYDFDYRQQKGPRSGDWTCTGLAEKIYESANVNEVKTLKINQEGRYRKVFQILTYNPAHYSINITPDGYDNQSIYNPQNGDVFSRRQEFSKISRRKKLGEIIGTDCGREYQDQRYFFFPYTQFLQPTLKDIPLSREQIAQLEMDYSQKIEEQQKGEAHYFTISLVWFGNNLVSSSQITARKIVILTRKIKTKIKTATIRVTQKSRELIKKAGHKIKLLFPKQNTNFNSLSANINFNHNNYSTPRHSKPELPTVSQPINQPTISPTQNTKSSAINTSPQTTSSPTSNSSHQITNQNRQPIQITPTPTTPTITPSPSSLTTLHPNNSSPSQNLNSNPTLISNQPNHSSPIVAFAPPPGIPSISHQPAKSNLNQNPSNANINASTNLKATTASTTTSIIATTTISTTTTITTPKIFYQTYLTTSTTTQPNCFNFSVGLSATTTASSSINNLTTPTNLFYHWQFFGLVTSSTASTTTLTNPLAIASSTEITSTSTIVRCFSPFSLNGQRINQIKINLSITTSSTESNLSPLATTSQKLLLLPPQPLKIKLANWLNQKIFSTSTMDYSTSGDFYLLGKDDLATSTATSADLILSGGINRPAEIIIFSTSTLSNGKITTSSTSTKIIPDPDNFNFVYSPNNTTTNSISWQKKIHLSTGDFDSFDNPNNPKSGSGWNELLIKAKSLNNPASSTTTKIAIKIDTMAPPALFTITATSTNDSDGDDYIKRGEIKLNWSYIVGKQIFFSQPPPSDISSYSIHYSTSATSDLSTSSPKWWNNSSSSEIIIKNNNKNNNRSATTPDNNSPRITFNSASSIFTIATSSTAFGLGGLAILSLKPEYFDLAHLQQSYYFSVRAKDFAGNISPIQGLIPTSSIPSHLADHLVIQEVRLDNSSSSQPYIELYNPTVATTSLENLYLFYVGGGAATSSKPTKIKISSTSTEIAPNSFYLIATASTTMSTEEKSTDKIYSSLKLSSKSGTLILASTSSSTKMINQDFIDLFSTSTQVTSTNNIQIIDRVS